MWVNKYIRVPFCEKGRTIDGCDCWGLVCLIYKNELGIFLPSYTEEYDRTIEKYRISKKIAKEKEKWVSVGKNEIKEFDVALMNRLGQPMHVGVVVTGRDIIHVEDNVNYPYARCVDINNYTIKNSLVGFYRHEGLL